jgi:hypothetical protein
MPADGDDVDNAPDPPVDDWADDDPDPRADEELTADIGSILAGVTVLPTAIGWWRTRRGRRAERHATSAATTERIRPPRWFEL